MGKRTKPAAEPATPPTPIELADGILYAGGLSTYTEVLQAARTLLGVCSWFVPPSAADARKEIERSRALLAKSAVAEVAE